MAHLMARLGLPVVVAARTRLGTINHTLLTIEALRARWLTVAGVMMVGDAERGQPRGDRTLWKRGNGRRDAAVRSLDAAALAEWAADHLDTENRLAEFLA